MHTRIEKYVRAPRPSYVAKDRAERFKSLDSGEKVDGGEEEGGEGKG